MDHTKLACPSVRSSGGLRHGLLRGMFVGLTLMSMLAADPALARRGKNGLPPGVKMVPVSQPAAQPAQAQSSKPVLHPRRHGSKPRGGSR